MKSEPKMYERGILYFIVENNKELNYCTRGRIDSVNKNKVSRLKHFNAQINLFFFSTCFIRCEAKRSIDE